MSHYNIPPKIWVPVSDFFVSSDSPLDIVLIAIVLIHSQIVSTVTSRGTSTSPAPAPTAISTSFHAQRAEPVI